MNIPIRPGVHQTLVETAKAKGVETGAERLAAMRPQCGFGELGTCCRICYMGPCRIDPFGNGPKTGICGASPDTMVARNLLRETIGGASSHVGHARHLLLTLRDALSGEAPYEIRGEGQGFCARQAVRRADRGADRRGRLPRSRGHRAPGFRPPGRQAQQLDEQARPGQGA